MGLNIDLISFIILYSSLLVISIIHLISLIKIFTNLDNYKKHFKKQYSEFFFVVLILAGCLNFYGYSIKKEIDNEETINPIFISKTRLWLFFVTLIVSLIASIFYYYINSIKNSENENNEDENSIDVKKLFSDALLVFQIYYLFYAIQVLVIKYKNLEKLVVLEGRIPFKFERNMAIIVEILFGLIGLAAIYFGKSITYAVYNLFIYVAFLIYRKQIADVENQKYIKIKFSVIDYIIVSIMMVLTLICPFFIKKK